MHPTFCRSISDARSVVIFVPYPKTNGHCPASLDLRGEFRVARTPYTCVGPASRALLPKGLLIPPIRHSAFFLPTWHISSSASQPARRLVRRSPAKAEATPSQATGSTPQHFITPLQPVKSPQAPGNKNELKHQLFHRLTPGRMGAIPHNSRPPEAQKARQKRTCRAFGWDHLRRRRNTNGTMPRPSKAIVPGSGDAPTIITLPKTAVPLLFGLLGSFPIWR